jgi:hypothetical protein
MPCLEHVTCSEPTVTPIVSAICSRFIPRSTRFLICSNRSGVNLIDRPLAAISWESFCMFSHVLHATARASRNGRVRGYRNMIIPELVKFTSVDFWTVRQISAALQSRPWCALRGGIAHSVCQEAHRYRLRRRAIGSGPFLSLVTGRVCRSWSRARRACRSPIRKALVSHKMAVSSCLTCFPARHSETASTVRCLFG